MAASSTMASSFRTLHLRAHLPLARLHRNQSYAPHIKMAFGWLHESLVLRGRVHGPSREAAWQLGFVFRLNDVQHRPKGEIDEKNHLPGLQRAIDGTVEGLPAISGKFVIFIPRPSSGEFCI